MLSDGPEKSRNPLVKVIRRRKKVTFSQGNTYVEASDVEYSSEEEEEEGDGEYLPNEDERAESQEAEREPHQDDNMVTEPLKTGPREPDTTAEPQAQTTATSLNTDQDNSIEKARTSDEMFETIGIFFAASIVFGKVLTIRDHDATSKSRKGTLRNTDSLFKDDNTETRKINLTPSLLRDDSSSSTVRSIEAKEVCPQKSINRGKRNRIPY